ncbi:uncharacterized protein LOC106758566 [Vigna radiata var. radiata]|uniref:Uncharacterized protein LOC106758566 n=1 Tax=Vigna radiata var. radiata TaxID=3916 RepID=A0A3Q0EZN8_VIGRR|nr:uncharacterized protein LOC106758566 [Vigna radiata var. radiata]
MDPVVSAVTESFLKKLGQVVKKQWGYFFNYKSKFEKLKSYVEELEGNRESLQHNVDKALENAEEIENEVQRCLKLMDEKIKKYKSYKDGRTLEEIMKICSNGFLPNNFHLKYQLGRKVTKMVEEIIEDGLWKKKFDKVSYQEYPSDDYAFSNSGYVSFASRTRTLEEIMEKLKDSTVDMIGVYGRSGMGKTFLVKEIAKKAKEKLFKRVIIANITGNPDFEKIQGQIAGMLDITLEDKNEIARANRIRKKLMKEKKNTLIILDDLWDRLDLNRLGISCDDEEEDDASRRDANDIDNNFGYNKTENNEALKVDLNKMKKEKPSNSYKGCKILLTSRKKEVLCDQMGVQESSTFLVEGLNEKEAETLVKKVADVKISEFDRNAIEIAKWSGGLPMALVSIGKTLKNKSLPAWENICQKIKRQSFTEELGFTDFSIKLSYDELKSEQLKCMFLQCARMGNDALIMDLVKFCIGLNLLQGVQTITDARKMVQKMIEELEESSLLVRSYSIDRFNMHDIVRGYALSICKEKQVLFMKNDILDEWPHEDDFERYTAIFLHSCDIKDELPKRLHCPRVEVLHIDNITESFKIPDYLFKFMIRLKVLVLTGVNLSRLPSSIKCLKKLRMLCLERCTLRKNLSIIGELKSLRILSLSGSNIESLPLEFGQLDKLQLFDISNCPKLRQIPSSIIPRMNILEEFYTRESLILWEAEETESKNASLSELRHLNHLQNLELHIQSYAHFPQNLFLDKLNSYKIVIGEFNLLNLLTVGEFKVPDKYEEVKFLALELKEGIDIHYEKWIKMLFKSVECLLLGELNDVRDIFYELNVEGFPNLKHLSIVNNFGIKYIINPRERFHSLIAFPKLESVWLYKLDNLEIICDNQLVETSFRNLKVIKIQTCIKLVNLFPFCMVRLLTELETIEVCDCDSLKEIVSKERKTETMSDEKIEFPKLRQLTLKSLPTFICLYGVDEMLGSVPLLQGQENTNIVNNAEHGVNNSCLPLFNEKVSIPKLESLKLSSINIQKIWSDQYDHCFENLLTLNVTDCSNLKYLLSFSMAESLMNLQSIFASECEMMEDIFRPEDAEYIDVFPKLKKMEIICMEKLSTIWKSDIGLHSFNNLNSLMISECHKLVTIFPNYMGHTLQSLQSLTVTDCKLVENIFDFANIPHTCDIIEANLGIIFLEKLPNLVNVWKGDTGEILKCNNLQSIRVDESPKLKYLFPVSIANDLQKLEVLEIWDCWEMIEIIALDKHSSETAITFKFPHLNTLSLIDLHELRSFYSGIHTLEWPPLKKLEIVDCSMLQGLTSEITNSSEQPIVLATKKAIYNLEYMSVSLKEAEWLQKYIVNVHRMHKLEELFLYRLKNNEVLFWFLHRLPNLKNLTLGLCHMKRICTPESLNSPEKIGGVMQLKELVLHNMWSLEEIGFEHDVLLQRVECLTIHGCTKLRNLASSSVSFSYLTSLEVVNCMMRNLMTLSTARTLNQLTTMKVSSCPFIVEIVAENEEEKVQEVEFKQLKSLELVSLQNLKSFSSVEKCDLKFPLLKKLVVSECPQMKKLSEVQTAPNLQKVHVEAGEKDKWYWEGDLNATLQTHFTNKVSFEYSKDINLVDYPERKIRHGKFAFPDNFFGCLKKLVFDEAYKRDTLIPSHVLPYLKNLEELNVEKCESTQLIFDVDESEIQMHGMVFRLKKLTLKHLSNLKCVWKENRKGIVSFPNLNTVVVTDCEGLVTLFPSSLARNFKKLKTLFIWCNKKLEEIVGKEEGTEHEKTIIFEFPCLSELAIVDMPLLSCFYPGKHQLECPLLETLYVAYAPKLKLFTSNSQKGDMEAPIRSLQQALFLVEKVPPKLTDLALNEENIMLFREENLPQNLLCKLSRLFLCFEDDKNEKNSLPFDLFHKLPNLEWLTVRKCFGLKEIFPSQKLQVHDKVLAGLKQLNLFQLKELECIGLENMWIQPYSIKLELLQLHGCLLVERIVYCAVSFINLKYLYVMHCERMEYLFTFATLKSLVKLETLSIGYCGSIKEIARTEEEDGSDEIIFGRLTSIKLEYLPRLISFYSGNATLQCPSLQTVMVADCPNMITFSEGVIKLAMFPGIQTSEDSDFTFHVDMNTTVESLFHEKEFMEYSKRMILEEYLGMSGVHHTKPIVLDNFFGSFKKLEFDAACNRTILIPSHVLPYLKNLEELNVKNSDAIQIIFDIDESEVKTKGVVFGLKKLTLNKLSNLKHVWKENSTGIISFHNLPEVVVNGCGSLITLFPLSLAKNLGKLKKLELEECEKMVEIVGREDEIEHGTPIMLEFPCLSRLGLEKMPLLSCFYPGKHHLECPLLDELYVACCPKLKLFTSNFDDDSKKEVSEAPTNLLQQPLFSIEKVCPNLMGLTFNEENMKLMSDARLPQDLLCKLNLLYFCFEDDNNEKGILPFDFFHRVPNLEELYIDKCFGIKEIFPSQKVEVHDKVLVRFKNLVLMELKELEWVGLEHPWVQPYTEKLELLKLCSCPLVEKLVSCAVSFINLKELYVKLCEKMEYLFTFATLKSLVKLETVKIQKCESIKEIVKKDDEDDCDEIVFIRLRSIELNSLPKLISFYSGNATLQCSYLKNVMVAECPNMITFSQGIIKVPMFLDIRTSKHSDLTFHSDLYTKIQKLFPNQVIHES